MYELVDSRMTLQAAGVPTWQNTLAETLAPTVVRSPFRSI